MSAHLDLETTNSTPPMRISWSAPYILQYVYICTDILMYLYYMYRYINVFVLCTNIWMYLYYMYWYINVFLLYVPLLIRAWSFRFVYSIYFPKPPQAALQPHSNYRQALQFAHTEPFRSSPLHSDIRSLCCFVMQALMYAVTENAAQLAWCVQKVSKLVFISS
jgi:hypothetical protein